MSLWLPEIRLRKSLLALPLAGLVWAGLAGSPNVASPAVAAESELSPLTERYRVAVEDDGIELTPLAEDSAVSSIEILDGEDEALVNGKAFAEAG